MNEPPGIGRFFWHITFLGTEYIGVERKRWECICLSAGVYTATLYVMVNIMKGGGRAPPTPHKPRLIFPSCWNVRQKAAVATLCVLCGFVALLNVSVYMKNCTYRTHCIRQPYCTLAGERLKYIAKIGECM